MAILLTDDFPEAGPALGTNWDINTGDGNPAGFGISSNVARPLDYNGDVSATNHGITWPNDQQISVTFGVTSAAGVGAGCGFVARSVQTGMTYYRVAGCLSGFSLVRAVSGTYNTLASGAGTTFTTADVLTGRFVTNGASVDITLYKNGVQFQTFSDTDASRILSGRGGLGYSSSDSGSTVDHFVAEDVPPLTSAGPLMFRRVQQFCNDVVYQS